MVEGRFPVELNEKFLYAGTLRRLVLEISANPDYHVILGKIPASNPGILDVAMQANEQRLLADCVLLALHPRWSQSSPDHLIRLVRECSRANSDQIGSLTQDPGQRLKLT